MKIKIYLLAILTSSGFWMNLDAQIPPDFDENWEMITVKSDEFNDTTIDLSLWNVYKKNQYPYGGGGYCFKEDHVLINSGFLNLKVERFNGDDYSCPDSSPDYYTGGIESVEHNYSYGYFEIRAKLPGFYDNGISDGEGFWPAFWTYYVEEDASGCRIIHDEIDILEPSGSQYHDAKSNVAGWHDEKYPCDHEKVSGNLWYTHYQPLFVDYHKYAVEWLPDRIIFYFDDEPFHITYNDPSLIMKPQFTVIDQQMDYKVTVNPNMPFPQYMKVDYFRYYELNNEFCGLDASIGTNSELYSFIFGVRKNIIIGTSLTPIYLSFGDRITFRASNEITINGDFTVPLGSELNLIPTPCNY